jgi:hypothetical protein
MNRILEGLRIVEGSAFVAAPLCQPPLTPTLSRGRARPSFTEPLVIGRPARREGVIRAVSQKTGRCSPALRLRSP